MTVKDKKIRVGFISTQNRNNPMAASGSVYYSFKLLDKFIDDLIPIDYLEPPKITIKGIVFYINLELLFLNLGELLKKFFYWLIGKNHIPSWSLWLSRYYARKIERKLEDIDCDLLFCDKNSICLAFLKTNIPIIYQTDATFRAMEDYYAGFTNLSYETKKNGNIIEKNVLERSKHVFTISKWAVDSMINDYGIARDKISIVPIPTEYILEPNQDFISAREKDAVCRLLYVGKDWHQKNGDLAIKTTEWLNTNGVKVNLSIVGYVPKRKIKKLRNRKDISVVGFIDKNIETQRMLLDNLFRTSHFLFVPSRMECGGRVFVEAAYYNLPVISTSTGGISSIVSNEQSGVLLKPNDSAYEFGQAIKEIWIDKDKYNAMRKEAGKVFKERLSGRIWMDIVKKVFQEIR